MMDFEEKKKVGTLGILVNTEDHPDYVISLAHAARTKGKTVRLHFSGPGVRLLSVKGMGEIHDFVQATACADSLARYGHPTATNRLQGVQIVASTELGRFISECHRYVTF